MGMGRGEGPTATGRLFLESAFVALLALVYLWPFRFYGFDVVDEGTILAQIDLVARGARPYLDFETGYTPGFFGLHALLWSWTGADLATARTFGVLLHAVTAALLYGVAARAAGRRVAAAVTLLHVAFSLPISMRFGAHFNIPYPGWLVAPLALLAQVAAASRARGPGARPLILAGLAAGAAFSVKPNSGILLLGGVALALPLAWRRSERGAVAVSTALRVAAPLGAIALVGTDLDAGYAFAVIAPIAAAAWAARLRDAEDAPVAASRPLVDLVVLGAAFLAPILPWLVPLWLELGAHRILSEVFLVDGGAAIAAYLVAYSPPSPATLALLGGLVAAALAVRSGRPRIAPLALGVGVVLAALLAEHPRLAAEDALLWLPPVVLVAGLLAGRSAGDRFSISVPERAILVVAAVAQAQMFPRPDFSHLAQIAPSLWLAGAVVWRRFADAWWRGLPDSRSDRWLGRAAIAGVAVIALTRALPSLVSRLGERMVPIDAGSRAPLVIAESAAPGFTWLAAAVHEVEGRTLRGEPVFSFPDLAGVAFLADRPVPFFYLYFVPGRPDRAAEHRTVDEITRIAPPLALVGPPRVAAFRGAETYFTDIAAALRQQYREVASGEGFRVLERSAP